MSSAPLSQRLVYGLRADVKDNVHYADDGSIIYPAGHNVVLYQHDTRTQRFILGSPESEGITAMAVSPNRKLLAVAERAEKAMISVYDLTTLKKRKVLLSTEANSKEYVSLCFSADGKTIVAQAGAPEWYLLVWSWEKAKVVASSKTTNQQGSAIYQCTCSPSSDSLLVAVVGQSLFRCLKLADSGLKQLPFTPARRDVAPLAYSCQAWLPEGGDAPGKAAERERQLLGTADGEVLLVEGSELRHTLSCDNGLGVSCLAVHSKGFLAGQEGGVVSVFERDDKEGYRRVRAFTVQGHSSRVRSMAVSPGEEQLAVTLDSGQMFSLSLISQEIMKADEMNFEVLGTPNHSGPVLGLDVCLRKPLVASCSSDRSVRLWNYAERGAELVKTFQDEALALALHPSGHLLAVGFADKVRLLSVLLDELKPVKELGIKGCRELAFCHGGHMLAAVNGTTVSVYNTYTGENVGNLRGHNGKVRSLCWSADDSKLVTAGMDGAVYEWRLGDLRRDKECVIKGCAYSCVAAGPEGRTLFASGSDRKLKELEEAPGAGTQVVREFDTGAALTQLLLAPASKVMFAATEAGTVRCYKWPLTGEFTELKVHSGPVTRLRLSGDESLLFSCGEDGAVCVLDVREKDGAKAAARRDVERLPWAEEVLVTRADLEERRVHMAELEQKVSELTMQTEYQLRLKDMHLAERLREEGARQAAELEAERRKAEATQAEKVKQSNEHQARLDADGARHAAQLAALDTQYQAKIIAEVERYQTLLAAHEASQDEWRRQNQVLLEGHAAALAAQAEEQEARLAEAELRCAELQGALAEVGREAEELRRQLEEDADREVEELRAQYEAKLQEERAAAMKYKSEAAICRKRMAALQKDMQAQAASAQELAANMGEVHHKYKVLEKDLAHFRREVRERDETIGEKERRIYDLKKKAQELEKFKFVLEYKNRELRGQVEPREAEIGELRGQIRDMDGELERYHGSNADLELTISNLKMRQAGLQAEVTAQRGEKQAAQEAVRRLEHELAALATLHDPRALKDRVAQLYQRYCSSEAAGPSADPDSSREASRQREYLERSLEGLRRKLARESAAAHSEHLRLMGDNCALLREVNELRREVRALRAAAGAGATAAAGLARPASIGRKSSPAGTLTASSSKTTLAAAARQEASMQQLRPGQLSSSGSTGGGEAGPCGADERLVESLRREVEMQRELIAQLRQVLAQQQLEQAAAELDEAGTGAAGAVRPTSRERLSPLGV